MFFEKTSYEIRRSMLKLIIKKTGRVYSLPVMSKSFFKNLLMSELPTKTVLVFDYDDTLEDYLIPLSIHTTEAIKRAILLGMRIVIATDRPHFAHNENTSKSILHSLGNIPKEFFSSITITANKGSCALEFDKFGQANCIYQVPDLTEEEIGKIQDAAEVLKSYLGMHGVKQHNGSLGVPSESFESGYTIMLEPGTNPDSLAKLTDIFIYQLKLRNINYSVAGKTPKDPKNPVYISLELTNKGSSLKFLSNYYNFQPKDAVIVGDAMFRGAPFPKGHLNKLGSIINGKSKIPIMQNDRDIALAEALPGALTFCVGGTGDPRIKNAYVAPLLGKAASLEILNYVNYQKK